MPVMQPSAWQQEYSRFSRVQQALLDARAEPAAAVAANESVPAK
jgi:formate dehydrogenase major subunit